MITIFVPDRQNPSEFFEYKEWTDINCPLHCHPTIEVVIVLSGTFIIKKEDKSYSLKENDIILIMPYERHEFITNQSSKIAVFEASTAFISNFDAIFKNKVPENPCMNLADDVLTSIFEHLNSTENNLTVELNCIFFTIFSLLLKKTTLLPYTEPDDFFRKAINYTNEHYTENISLKDVAEALNVSYVYLSRIFSKKNTVKFNDFINSFRLQKSITLLLNSPLSISEICYSCGFGSIRNFNRVFFKTMNCTPNEFRNKHVTSAKNDSIFFDF